MSQRIFYLNLGQRVREEVTYRDACKNIVFDKEGQSVVREEFQETCVSLIFCCSWQRICYLNLVKEWDLPRF